MAHRIEVRIKDEHFDALGSKIAKRIRRDLRIHVEDVRTVQVYTTDIDLAPDELQILAAHTFCDAVTQEAFSDACAAGVRDFDWLIEVGYLPGVTDNVGRTARESAAVRLGRNLRDEGGFYSSIQYLIRGELDQKQAEEIAGGLLANGLIQRWIILRAEDLNRDEGVTAYVPKVASNEVPPTETVDLEIPDDELVAMSKQRTLALNLLEMHTIRQHYRSEKVGVHRKTLGLAPGMPTDVELETLAQTWSEHCKHKIFASNITYYEEGTLQRIESLFDTYIKGSTKQIRREKGSQDFCQSVFVDNAGVIRFNDEWSLVMKVETHNSPSALDPYGGALTGIVGVNRDPFGTGMGAKLIFNTDVFCFATPFWDKPIPPRLLHPKRIFEGVREGVEHGGNKSGIPTVNGSIVFDDRYAGKPLVFCGTGGLLPSVVHDKPGWEKCALKDDLIVMTGGRIGADGIHGATFSSEQLHEDSPATAVQIGDPITQKRMTDFLLIARDRNLYNAITDNGAGGLASSVGEMAQDCGGCEIHLDKAPLKYAGLAPWMILVSESQERMTLATPKEKIDELIALAKSMDVEATVIGNYTDSGYFNVNYNGDAIASLSMEFLHDGLPPMELTARWDAPVTHVEDAPKVADWLKTFKRILGRLNICSKEYVVRQYDHEVQGGSVIKPLCGAMLDGPSDAAVIRPLLDSMEAVVVSHGLCPRYSDIDAYDMATNAVDEALRNAVAVGGNPAHMAGLDNFCWCDPVAAPANPDGEYKLAQLVRANRGLFDATVAYGIPCISGKDSMKNDYMVGGHKISIPPTLLFSIVGVIENASKCVTMDAKSPGDFVYVLGTTRLELGASEYFAEFDLHSADVPRVRIDQNLQLYTQLHRAILAGCVRSCHDCSDGGLAVALAETAFAGDLGLDIELARIPTPSASNQSMCPEELLFSESAGRFVVTVSPERREDFEFILAGCDFAEVGQVIGEKELRIENDNKALCELPINELKAAWKKTLDFKGA